ncbi:MAG: ferredoxin [Patescibacteria group bacterium]|nr:ferredoxin [Patescibacteria group bacterium]
MKPIVNREACIGCGLCEGADDTVFKVIDGKSEVQYQDAEGNMIVFEDHRDTIEKAIRECPVTAISWEGSEEAEGASEEGLSADPTVEPMAGLDQEDMQEAA